MSEDRLDRALEEMKQEAVDAATLDAVRARVWNTLTEHGRCRLCGVPARLPRVPERNPHRRQARAAGRPCQPLRRVSHRAGRDEGRTAGDRHAAAVVFALAALGNARRGSRAGLLSPVSRTRHPRRLDGARRPAGDGRLRQRRAVPPAPEARSKPAPPSARRNGSARALARTRRCASPTDRPSMSTSERSCS